MIDLDNLFGTRVPKEPPHSNSYVVPNTRIIAGDYAGHATSEAARKKVKSLVDYGINFWVDLTRPEDGMTPYLPVLRELVESARFDYRSFPIRDNGVPTTATMVKILDALDAASDMGLLSYVHCWGGVGRTGTVIGCYLVRHGMDPEAALKEVDRLFRTRDPKKVARHSGSPETEGQREFVRKWAKIDPHLKQTLPTRSITDRCIGALVGLAVGDALGTTLEFKHPGTFAPISDMESGGPFHLQAGQWTDDTSMALCLGESLIESKGFNAEDQMQRYLRWLDDGYWSSTGGFFDIGVTTRQALERFRRSGDPFSGSTDKMSAGNGSLMRLVPIALYYVREPEFAIGMAADSSRTTHAARASIDACRYFAGLLIGALRGEPKAKLLSPFYSPTQAMWGKEPLCEEIRDVASLSFLTSKKPPTQNGGYVVDTLKVALWGFANFEDFRTGALAVVNLGGDADTTGAVYGQIAGAYYGENGIPPAWRERITHGDKIKMMAQTLCDCRRDGLSLQRSSDAEAQARTCLAWAGGDYNLAIEKVQTSLDEMGYGGSLAGRAVTERVLEYLQQWVRETPSRDRANRQGV